MPNERSYCYPRFKSKDDFEAFQAIIPPDKLEFPYTFDEWIIKAESLERDCHYEGEAAKGVPIDLIAFSAWCSQQDVAPCWPSIWNYSVEKAANRT